MVRHCRYARGPGGRGTWRPGDVERVRWSRVAANGGAGGGTHASRQMPGTTRRGQTHVT